ncbi:unnamed protein product [Alopecurus aequalis]
MASPPEFPQWSGLLPDLLGKVISHLPHIADRARFRAVCRSWHSAVRLHVSPRQRLPWVVLHDGAYLTPSDGGVHRLPLPKNTTCVGSTGDWIALDCPDEVAQTHTYTLHNHFSSATVPLTELDSIIGKVPDDFQIRKVLMRSTPDDLIAVTGNIWRHPLILCRPGKGAWAARALATPYFRIIDIAFLGGKLYAITRAEDLYAIHLAEDDQGKPTVTSVKHIIKHAPGHDDDIYNVGVWWTTDIDQSSNQDTEEESDDEAPCEEDEDQSSNQDTEEESDDEAPCEEGDEDDYDVVNQEDAHDELVADDSDSDDEEHEQLAFSDEFTLSDCEDGVREGDNAINTSRYLVESRGKLLMVKRVVESPPNIGMVRRTRSVEVFEADMETGAWVPVNSGLGGGQAIFISNRLCSTMSASGDVEEDVVYFSGTNDVFDMRSKNVRPVTPIERLSHRWRTWVFPPDLVV